VTIWLITAVILLSMVLGGLLVHSANQARNISRLEGRIQGIAGILRNIPKRKSDRILEN